MNRSLALAAALLALSFLLAAPAQADDPCAIPHPLDPPEAELQGVCHICGMQRPMWARTWFTFENAMGQQDVCSLHDLAVAALQTGEAPDNVMVASYLSPENMFPADEMWFLVGSRIRGTMSPVSKPAFRSPEQAKYYATTCGGEVMDFAAALARSKELVRAASMGGRK
jgi:nitrous oxide reductase accessory protein NosL